MAPGTGQKVIGFEKGKQAQEHKQKIQQSMKAFFWEGQLGELALGKEFHSAGTGKVAIPLKVA